MKVVLHAGFPKTGSSSLQEYLASHRLSLSQAGILYPKFDKFASHWALTGAFHDVPHMYHHVRRRIATDDVSQRLNAARKRLHSLLAAVKDDTVVVLSHEGFGADLSAAKGVSELREMLLGFTDHVQVVAYARNPVELYPSSIQQRLKTLNHRIKSPAEWVSDQPARAEHLRSIFGEDHCEIRIYSSSTLLNGDIIDEFADYLFRTTGKQIPLSMSRERHNASHSGPACAILFALKSGVAGDLDGKTFARVRNQLASFGAIRAAPKIKLPKEWIEIIAARHADTWNRFVETTSYSSERKAVHRLPSVMDPCSLSAEEFREWLLGFGSREYTLAFADFCEGEGGHFVRDCTELLRKLALHFPSTGTEEPTAKANGSLSQAGGDAEKRATEGAFRDSSAMQGWWGQIRKRARAMVRLLSQRVLGRHYHRVKAVLMPGP